jgi:hypothetical protein
VGIIDGAGRKPRVRTFEYAFGTLGGTTGAKNLVEINGEDDAKLNQDELIIGCVTECITAATSGGAATIKLGITGNDDCFEGATAYTDNSFDTVDTVDVKESELPLKITTAGGVNVVATIAGAALTAGVFRVYVTVI